MKSLKFLFLSLLILAFSCTKEEKDPDAETQLTVAELVGSWTASSAIHTNNANSAQTLDFIGVGGNISITILNGGGTRTWVSYQETSIDEWDSKIEIGPNKTITSTPVESARGVNTFTYEYETDKLTLTNKSDKFDFTNSGAELVSTTSVITFVPN